LDAFKDSKEEDNVNIRQLSLPDTLAVEQFEYSEKEMKLIAHFGFDKIAPSCFPSKIYDLMAMEAFRLNMPNDKYVESLRRCYEALVTIKYRRLTKQFDDLIQLD
jgi:hypothetical protein